MAYINIKPADWFGKGKGSDGLRSDYTFLALDIVMNTMQILTTALYSFPLVSKIILEPKQMTLQWMKYRLIISLVLISINPKKHKKTNSENISRWLMTQLESNAMADAG